MEREKDTVFIKILFVLTIAALAVLVFLIEMFSKKNNYG